MWEAATTLEVALDTLKQEAKTEWLLVNSEGEIGKQYPLSIY